MRHKSVIVKVDITDGGLNDAALNALLDELWLVAFIGESTPGSFLVIVQKEE